MKRKIYIVLAVIAIVALLTGYIVFLLNIRTGQGLKALVAENDSLESANWNLNAYIQFRHDSIATEDSLRFDVSFFIKDGIRIEHMGNRLNIYHELRDSWIDSLENKKFELEDTWLLIKDCRDYEFEDDKSLWDIRENTYTREVYGRKISVVPHYKCLKRTWEGEEIPESKRKTTYDNVFDIKFTSKEDYDYFLQSLRKHDYVKKISEWRNSKGEIIYAYMSDFKSKDSSITIRLCDDPFFCIEENYTIKVQFKPCQD